jgi:hypothetical protein
MASPRFTTKPVSNRRRRAGGPRSSQVQPVAESVKRVLELRGLTTAVRGNRIAVEWEQLVGARVAANSVPDGIRSGSLVIKVASSAWLHQLSMMRASLLTSLLDALGPPALFSDIRLVLGNGTLTGRAVPESKRTVVPTLKLPPITLTAAAQIIDEVDSIDDVELRSLIGAIRLKHAR